MILTRIPKDIPLVAALACGLGFLAFGFTAMFLDPRPSSTAAIGLLFIPIWSVAAGAAGLVLGLVGRSLWNRLASEATGARAPLWLLPGLVVLAVSGASLFGWWVVVQEEEAAKPAIVVDKGVLERRFVSNFDALVRSPVQLYKYDRAPQAISWGGNKSEVEIERNEVRVRDTNVSKGYVVVSTSGLDYITRIDAVPLFTKTDQQPLLAVVISGRATGRRAIVLVIALDYTTLYEERLFRFWQLDEVAVEIRKEQQSNSEGIVVGPGCDKSLVIRRKVGA